MMCSQDLLRPNPPECGFGFYVSMLTPRHILLFAGVIAMLASPTRSQTIAPYAGEFLSIGAGARSLAMGGAYTALASDASGGYWNPSALTLLSDADIMLMHEERFAGLLNYDLAAAATPYGEKTTLGVTLLRLGVDGIPDSRNALIDQNGNGLLDPGERLDYNRITYVNSSDWAFLVSYAHRASPELSYGLSIKLVRRSLAEFTATGIGFDAGILYTPTASLFLGVAVQDITTTLLAWSTGRTELIAPTVRLGGAYSVKVGPVTITPALECAIRFENRGAVSAASIGAVSFDPYAGLEIGYGEAIALRGGVNEIGHAALGAGLQIKRLHVDYAFTGFGETSELGTSHRISLRLRLDQPF